MFRTVAFSESEEYLKSCQASMMHHFSRNICNPGIFKTLVYAEPEEYSEPCQACI